VAVSSDDISGHRSFRGGGAVEDRRWVDGKKVWRGSGGRGQQVGPERQVTGEGDEEVGGSSDRGSWTRRRYGARRRGARGGRRCAGPMLARSFHYYVSASGGKI
jgi:hypothetical protein